MKECDCGARFQVHERDCASLDPKELGVLTADGLGKTLIILSAVFCIMLGMVIGTGASIYQISGSYIFEDMAEGMTCESLIDTYQEDPKGEYGLPTDESSWWYVGIAGNDAMGNEINNRCLVDGEYDIIGRTIIKDNVYP